jgi:amidase
MAGRVRAWPAAAAAIMYFTSDPFVAGERFHRKGAPIGPLKGLRFALKDNFDAAGRCTRLGLAGDGMIAAQDADLVADCLAAGADLLGKLIMDELAFSLLGVNATHGAPVNPAAPGRIAGGSSCGAASVVAQGLADFALGSDTAGSIRVPASCCGLWGLRPTHAVLSTHGMTPLAPSFDAPGWVCTSNDVLRLVSKALLPYAEPREIKSALICDWLFEGAQDRRRDAIEWARRRNLSVTLQAAPPVSIESMIETFRVIQGREAYVALSGYADRSDIPEDIAGRLRAGAGVTAKAYEAACAARIALAAQLEVQLQGAVMLAPAAPPPFLLSELDNPTKRDVARTRILTHTVLASLAGVPQMVAPMWRDARGPVGLGLIGPRGSDRELLALCIHEYGLLHLKDS